VVGAGVLSYILAGILIISGAVLLAGASAADSIGREFGGDTSSVTAELAFDGFVDLVAAGLLITGGVMLTGRKRRGRTMLISGCALTLAACVYWLVRTSAQAGTAVFDLLYGALAVIALVLAVSGTVTQWLNGAAPAARSAYPG